MVDATAFIWSRVKPALDRASMALAKISVLSSASLPPMNL